MLTAERCEEFAEICDLCGWDTWATAWLINAQSLRDGGTILITMPAPKPPRWH